MWLPNETLKTALIIFYIKLTLVHQGWIWEGVLWGMKQPPPNFYHEQARKLVGAVQVQLHTYG